MPYHSTRLRKGSTRARRECMPAGQFASLGQEIVYDSKISGGGGDDVGGGIQYGPSGQGGGFSREQDEAQVLFGVEPGERSRGSAVAESARRRLLAETVGERPSETPGRREATGLIRYHGRRGGRLEDGRRGPHEVFQEARDIGRGGVRSAPGSTQIAPVGAVPIPVGVLLDLT